jgi:probable HAF family extracellular repeat protein
MSQFAPILVAITAIVCPSAALALAAPTATFTPFYDASCDAVSGDGKIVTGATASGLYLWTAATGVEVFPLPANQSFFKIGDISGDGATVVGGLRATGGQSPQYQGFKWTRNGGFTLLGNLSSGPNDWAYANAVSHDASVIAGTNHTPNGNRAFRWTSESGQIDLGHLGIGSSSSLRFSNAYDVSADGSIIVGAVGTTADAHGKGYRWKQAGGFEVIPFPPGAVTPIPNANANAISGDGTVVAGAGLLSGSTAWTWTASTGMVGLPTRPGNPEPQVNAISYDGSAIVGTELTWGSPTPVRRAAIWRKEEGVYREYLVQDLLTAAGVDLSNWMLFEVNDVSYDGRTLVGTGFSPDGRNASWVASFIVPEPGSLALTGIPLAVSAAIAMFRLVRR